MAAPTTHDWMDLEVVSATNLRNHINAPINYGIGRDIGTDAAVELEDSLALPAGAFFLGLPAGTTGQRPAGGEGRFRWNTTTGLPELHDGSSWRGLLDVGAVTFAQLLATGAIGNTATTVPRGDHIHDGLLVYLAIVTDRTGNVAGYVEIATGTITLATASMIRILYRSQTDDDPSAIRFTIGSVVSEDAIFNAREVFDQTVLVGAGTHDVTVEYNRAVSGNQMSSALIVMLRVG